jgi:hypothetical protein
VVRGQKYVRTYTFLRTTGPKNAVKTNVSWLGNDGTFSSRDTVNLPLNLPTTLDVKVNPAAFGAHSAILRLDDPTTVGIDFMSMNSVFVPVDFTAANSYQFTTSGQVGRNATSHFFVRVPSGAGALKVDLSGGGATSGAGQIRFLRFDPQGIPIDSNASTNCYNPDAGAGCGGGTATSRSTVNPLPGVWELVVEARRTSDVLQAPFTLTATLIGVTISPNPDVIASAAINSPLQRTYTLTNRYGAFTGRLVGGGALASTESQRPSIAEQTQLQFPVTIPSGVSSFTAQTGNAADAGADIDLYVFRCAPNCVQVGASTGGTAVEQVTLANPAAGQYVLLVDGFAVPSGSTAFDLTDSWTSAALGSLTSTDTDAAHASGSTWTAPAVLVVQGQPGAGRTLTGTLSVQTDSGTVVGVGRLVVQEVTG